MRTRSPFAQPISKPSEHQRVSDRSTATRPSCRRSAPGRYDARALEQQSARLHDPRNPLGIDRRAALFPAAPPDHGVDSAIAVGRHRGDDLLDLGQQLGRGPGPAPATPARRGDCRRHHEVGARHPERVKPRFSRGVIPTGRGRAQQPLFWLHQIQRLTQDLVLQCLLAQQPPQLAHLALQASVF